MHNQRVRRRTVARRMYGGTTEPPCLRASEVRCYLQFFQRLFYIRIRVMVQISSSWASPSLVFIDREVVSFFDFAANCKLRLIYRAGLVKNDRNKKKLKHCSWGF